MSTAKHVLLLFSLLGRLFLFFLWCVLSSDTVLIAFYWTLRVCLTRRCAFRRSFETWKKNTKVKYGQRNYTKELYIGRMKNDKENLFTTRNFLQYKWFHYVEFLDSFSPKISFTFFVVVVVSCLRSPQGTNRILLYEDSAEEWEVVGPGKTSVSLCRCET